MSPFAEAVRSYRELSPWQVWRHGSATERRAIFGGWLLLLLLCMALGVASVKWSWSGLPFDIGGVTAYVTLYPPLPVCLLLSLTLGWWWGAVPAYCSTLALALYAGMPLQWALLFAGANPLGFAMMVAGYRAIAVGRDLRSLTSILFFAQLSFIGSIFSSAGALIWSYTNHLAPGAHLPIWQGWWIGSFLQCLLIGGPATALLWPRVARWQEAREALMRKRRGGSRYSVLRMLAAVAAGVLIYGYVTIHLAENEAAALPVFRQTVWIFYWVFAAIIVAIAFFGYQLFAHWQASTDGLLSELRRMNSDLERLATTDALTGLLNRRAADRLLDAEWQRARRSGHVSSLVLLDIDHFKQVNDSYGHPGGDAALRALAACIRSVMREVDVAARYGGEEFLVVLPETGREGAFVFAERLRERVAASEICHDGQVFRCHISLGIAVSDKHEASYEQWVRRADQALYRAKQGGRNQAVMGA
ncbi:diguanylate cyclase [Pseudoduganella sp. DS3]|uniref:diguanylate cyclase n=1 Tax=Pseudoduganella guangdongensis TaxID=2692179 RepID=A0A6N9HFW2_9BURK|nr:diguanylate cyclase [Pseudoduganella guangdongensis]MYN02481.1 diguanylate cyclase [Pseudoduganella guangdongensis]